MFSLHTALYESTDSSMTYSSPHVVETLQKPVETAPAIPPAVTITQVSASPSTQSVELSHAFSVKAATVYVHHSYPEVSKRPPSTAAVFAGG